MNQTRFKLSRLALSLSLITGAGALAPVSANDDVAATTDVEVIQVTGIRGSLAKSMDIKRESTGVVDAITAEDIGKFPDTNLAESLQRITGVSIDRSNNEGSKITVRGFGPEFNLVTLNGRQMPTTGVAVHLILVTSRLKVSVVCRYIKQPVLTYQVVVLVPR